MRRNWLTRLEVFVERYAQSIGKSLLLGTLVFLYVPLLVIFIMSFAEQGVLSFPPEQLTLKWYQTFLEHESAIESIVTTLKITVVATPLTVVLALLFSFGIVRFRFRGDGVLRLLVVLPIVIPLVVVGVALLLFYGIVRWQSDFWAIILAHVVRTLPFAVLVILPTLVTFDRSLEEASMDLGASEIETFRRVTLPNIFPGILAAGLLVFAISFNEFVYTYFVRGTGTEPLSIYIWTRVRFDVTPEVNVISVVFLAIVLGLMAIAVKITNIERLTLYR